MSAMSMSSCHGKPTQDELKLATKGFNTIDFTTGKHCGIASYVCDGKEEEKKEVKKGLN